METKDYEASMLQPKKVTITNTTDNEFDLQMYRVNLQLLIGGRSSKYPDGQEVDFIIESSEEYVYYASVIENLGDEWNIDNNHKISIAFEDAGGGSAVLIEKSITANGEYNASSDEADGYSKVTVNVPASGNINFDWDKYASNPTNTSISQEWLSHNLDSITKLDLSTVPSSITELDDYAFNTYGITEVVLPQHITRIGDCTFSECNALTTITIPGSVESIGESAFYSDVSVGNLESVTFETPSSLQTLGSYCFGGQVKLPSIRIPESVTEIGSACFDTCQSLESVIFEGNNVTSIGEYAFRSCAKLPSITIPASVTSIGEDCFSNCSALETITINKAEGSITGAPWGAPETTQIIWNG